MSSSPHKVNQIKGWIGGGGGEGGGTEGLEAQHVATLDGTCKKEKKTQGNDRSYALTMKSKSTML